MTNNPTHGQEPLPPEARGLRMPADVPGGLGFLGAMKYAAIRRVIEERERTLMALERHEDAEAAALDAHGRKEAARERLRSLDLVRGEARELVRQQHDATLERGEMEKLRRRLDRLELERKVAEAERALAKTKGEPEPDAPELDEFMDALRRFPNILNEVNRAKEAIRAAAPDGVLGEAEQQMLDMLDAMVASWAARRAEQMAR